MALRRSTRRRAARPPHGDRMPHFGRRAETPGCRPSSMRAGSPRRGYHPPMSDEVLGKSEAAAMDASVSTDVYFSADVETDGPIPGPYSMLSFALVPAGRFDGERYVAPEDYRDRFYVELRPISESFEPEAMAVNGLDRGRLAREGREPGEAMRAAADWVRARCTDGEPILVAYPLGFDWSFIHWYFVRFAGSSPFRHSSAFDLKTAVSVSERVPISRSGRSRLPASLMADHEHTHHAADDAVAQAEIFAKVMAAVGRRHER